MVNDKNFRQLKRSRRVRNRIAKSSVGYRLTVYRSNRYIYAQIIDQSSGKTVLGIGEKNAPLDKQTKIDKAKSLGKLLAEKALEKKIKKIVFDRGPYKFHGRIKALAEGAKEAGLVF